MQVTTKDTNKIYQITLRWWNGKQWSEDVAGELLIMTEQEQELQYLAEDIATFNSGKDLDWLTHSPACQQALLTIEEVADNG